MTQALPSSATRRAHRRGAWFGLAALAAGCLAAGSAQAQVYGFFDTWHSRWGASEGPPVFRETEALRRADVRAMLAERGYQVRAPLERNGDVYLADTIDPRGRSLRLVVDAYDGRILERFPGALPRPAIGLREEALPPLGSPGPVARGGPYVDERGFEDADRFDDQRAARSSARSLDQRYVTPLPDPVGPNGEPRVIPGIGPEKKPAKSAAKPPEPPRRTVARTDATAKPAQDAPAAKGPETKTPEPKPLASEAVKTPDAPAKTKAETEAAPQPRTAAAPRIIPIDRPPADQPKAPETKAEEPKVIPAPPGAPVVPLD